MILLRFTSPEYGGTRVGALTDAGIIDLSFARRGTHDELAPEKLAELRAILAGGNLPTPIDPNRVTLLAPVATPGTQICIGLNYAQHAAESGVAPPKDPVIFIKHHAAWNSPFGEIAIPVGSVATDYEVELAVAIGAACRNVSEENALRYVAGAFILNDVSERDHQLKFGSQWCGGKGHPTFSPAGPYLVTLDEIEDLQNLGLRLWVNGELRQNSSTSDMIFGVAKLVSFCSTRFALQPGDIITTGTPQGVGMGQKPEPKYLNPGDVVELEIDGLGRSRQVCVAEQAA